jgi:cilia- and flagella-associated protein 52
LSGGDDGIVRVWARKTRKLITQITAHKKTITRVFPDLQKSNIIHSCSADKIIHSFDLKTEKKVILHQAKNGTVLSMSQRKDNELELSMNFNHLVNS